MKIEPFALERYFAQYEFSAKYLLSSSDCDGFSMNYLLDLADEETKELWNKLTLGYTESLGHPLLRQEIAKLYSGISADEIITFVPEEGIYATMNVLLEKGDDVICTFPGYQSLYQVADALGCTVTKWLPDEKQNWRFDPVSLEDSIKPNTKLIVFNFPHNPTGYYPSSDDFQKIIDIAKKHDLYIFSDEMYRFLEHEPASRIPSAVEAYDKAVTLFGMSKTFGLAGLRTGWIVTRDKKVYSRLTEFKDYLTICGSAPSEVLSIIGLRAKDTLIESNIAKIKKNLEIANDFMNRHSDQLSWSQPNAGTIGFPRLNSGDSYEFCQEIVRDTGVMLLPSRVYDYGDSHFRLGFGRDNFPEALNVLDEYLEKIW